MSEKTFRSSIRQAVRGLWNGALSQKQFEDALASAIKRNLTNAWNEGALECGISAEELTEDERRARDAFLEEQAGYAANFGEAIRTNDKIAGGKLDPLYVRAEMWVNRYKDARNRAKVMACADEKLEWVLGPTEEHCSDCSRYDGKVYRASTWAKYDIRPQSPRLACHGFRCQCRLDKSDKKLTKGKPPRMTG